MVTLLMVILVARLLPPHLVPLGLGIHKSMEMTSTSTSQTLSGIWLDSTWDANDANSRYRTDAILLRAYWGINVFQLACAVLLWRFEHYRRFSNASGVNDVREYEYLPMETGDPEDERLSRPQQHKYSAQPAEEGNTYRSGVAETSAEMTRSIHFFKGSLGWIAVAWMIFLGTAWTKL